MPDTPHRRRFVAGAVCPRCSLMDKMVIDADTDQRLCMNCGFCEDRPGLPGTSPSAGAAHHSQELPTRVSRAAARRVQTPAQKITLIDSVSDRDKPPS